MAFKEKLLEESGILQDRCRWAGALLLILTAALLLRVYGIDFGLPELLHPDEPFEINRALRLAAGSFDWRRAGKGGLYYLLFLEMGVAFVFLYLRGIVSGPGQFAEWFVGHEHLFYLAGRWTCALLSTGSVLLIYLIGKRLGGRRAGLLAATMQAISPIAVAEAHYSTVDDLLVFCLLCGWLFLLKALDQGSRRHWLAAAAFSGLALITKLSGVVLLLPLLGAVLLLSGGDWRRRLLLAGGVLTVFMLVTMIGEPGYFRGIGERLKEYLHLFLPQVGPIASQPENSVATDLIAQKERNVFLYYLGHMVANAGWPLLLLAFGSLVWLSLRRERAVWVFGLFLLPYLLLICLTETNLVYARYLLPAMPLVYLLAALGAERISRRLGERRLGNLWVTAGLLLALAPVLPNSWAAARYQALPSTQMLAREWVHAHVSDGSRILLEGGAEHRSQYLVPLYNQASNIEGMIEEIRERDPGKARYWELKLQTLSRLDVPRYDLRMVMRHDPWPDFSEVQKAGIEYVVVETAQFSQPDLQGLGPALQTRGLFYRQLQSGKGCQKVADFATSDHNWGPGLEIYRLVPKTGATPSDQSL